MGCGCNSSPFREEVERTILSYINRLKLTKNKSNFTSLTYKNHITISNSHGHNTPKIFTSKRKILGGM